MIYLNNYKGSKGCMFTLIRNQSFIKILNNLLNDTGATISFLDNWEPDIPQSDKESELKDFLAKNFTPKLGKDIESWWLAVSKGANTPNWDLVSTCTIQGKKGILLVEAKAHHSELHSGGKPFEDDKSDNSKMNHDKIYSAIQEANSDICKSFPELAISRDKCYQLSNRIAHAWWLASNGIPVVLLYLGFLKVSNMDDGKCKLFYTDEDWQNCFLKHAKLVGVESILNKRVNCDASSFILISKSL